MPPTIAGAKIVIDRDAHTITLTRVLAAPREQVFDAWTRPEHVTCWWDPAGEKLVECAIDLRPGGAFRFVVRHSGPPPFAGVYREIAPPHRLVFEAMGAIGRVDLDETGGGTFLTVTIACGSAEQLEQFLKMGVDAGTAQTLDNLVAYIGATAPRTSGARDVPGAGG
jgi:uncharacterized protein YndB with AHSA1/START domain